MTTMAPLSSPLFAALTIGILLAGCGGGAHRDQQRAQSPTRSTPAAQTAPSGDPPAARAAPAAGQPQALVTAETENRLIVVNLLDGHVAGRISMPADPEDIAASRQGGWAIVVSSRAGKVTVLRRPGLHRVRTFAGFAEPHIVGLSPDGRYAYVTDDSRGTLTAIRLADLRETDTVRIGLGAHHLTFTPDERRVWVALGESAHTIVILNTSNLARPRVVGNFHPGLTAHDLSFSPDGRRVWVTSSTSSDVSVLSADTRRLLFRVPVGPGPQHVAVSGRYVYLTSGYGSTIVRANAATGRVINRARTPYGSFELSAADGYVAVSSLLRGTLAIYTPSLRRLRVLRLAPVTRELAISRP